MSDIQIYKTFESLKDCVKSIPCESVAERLGLGLIRTGNSLQGDCPSGHVSKGGRCFSINSVDNYGHCFNCGRGFDNIAMVQEKLRLSFPDAIKWIADNFGIKHSVNLNGIAPKILSPKEEEELNKFHVNALLFESAFSWMHNLLFEEEGKEVLRYLTEDRNYDPEVLKNTEFCYFPQVTLIKGYLQKLHPGADNDLVQLPLSGASGDKFKLAIPYRNVQGQITGFLKRATCTGGITYTDRNGKVNENARWDSTQGTRKHDIFNLSKCKGQETLIVVEGYPDAVYFTALGIPNVVAVGQGILSENHLEGMKLNRVKNVIISLDNDEVGPGNTVKAIKLLLTESDITPFVLDPKLLSPSKDPDEYVRVRGLDAFKIILDMVTLGSVWASRYLLEKSSTANPIAKKKALDEVINLAGLTKNPIDKEEIISVISKSLKCSMPAVKELLKLEQEKVASVQGIPEQPTGRFWTVKDKDLRIDIKKYMDFIVAEGFSKFYMDKDYTFVRTNSKIVSEYSLPQIKDHILSYVRNIEEVKQGTKNKLYETLYNNVGHYFSESLVECIPPVDIKFKRDEKDRAYVYYKNGYVCLGKNKDAGLSSYKELESPIWQHIINERSLDLIKVKYKKPEYEQFLWNVVGGNQDRFLSLCSVIGYMMHGHKEESNAKAIVLCDQKIPSDGEPNGRTGKSLIGKALEKIKNIERVDGKNFDFKSTFTFQMVKLGTQIIDFNDVDANFDFEKLFSVITDGMTIEYKNKTPFVVPFSESPKIMISTNYTIKGIGSSYKDRMFEIEFTDHYNTDHKPKDEFGHDFFTGWDPDEWNRFDNFMLECLQLYLDEGLVGCNLETLNLRKLIDLTSIEFVEFAEESIELNKEYNLNQLYNDFKKHIGFENDTFNPCPVRQKTFTSWLMILNQFKKKKFQKRQSNGRQLVMLAA